MSRRKNRTHGLSHFLRRYDFIGCLRYLCFYDVVFQDNVRTVHWFTWIDSGAFEISWALKLDTLTAVMLLVVCNISAIIHVYSIGYMHHDPARPRFFCYLSLFTFLC